MKKRAFISLVFLLIAICFLTACDPIFPPGNLKVENVEKLSQGTSVEIKIIYPNTEGSLVKVLDWKDQSVEVLKGEDIIDVSDLTITGLKPGKALIKVNATTVISEEAAQQGYDEKVYSTEVELRVE